MLNLLSSFSISVYIKVRTHQHGPNNYKSTWLKYLQVFYYLHFHGINYLQFTEMSYYWWCLKTVTQAFADFTINYNYRKIFVKLAILLNHIVSRVKINLWKSVSIKRTNIEFLTKSKLFLNRVSRYHTLSNFMYPSKKWLLWTTFL